MFEMVSGGVIGKGIISPLRKAPSYIPMTASGEHITLEKPKEEVLSDISVYGWSKQETTTGAQLLDISDVEEITVNGITYSFKNGMFKAKGTATGHVYPLNILLNLQPGTYTLSGYSRGVLNHVYTDIDGNIKYYFTGSNGSVQFNIDGSETIVRYRIQIDPGSVIDATFYVTLNAGATALPWEPYTGGIPSPNPDYPQEITSAGESGSITIEANNADTKSNTATLTAGLPLRAIPVSYGGNVTINGQKYIADVIKKYADGSGEIVKITKCLEYDENTNVTIHSTNSNGLTNFMVRIDALAFSFMSGICTHLLPDENVIANATKEGFIMGFDVNNNNTLVYTRIFQTRLVTVDEFKQWCKDVGFKMLIAMKNETIIPLTAEELSQLMSLRTYKPVTNIYNDADCYMEVNYMGRPIQTVDGEPNESDLAMATSIMF